MSEEYTYRDALKSMNIEGLYYWQRAIYKHSRLAKILVLALLTLSFIIASATWSETLGIIYGVCFITGAVMIMLATIFYKYNNAFILLFLGVTLVGISVRWLGIVLVVMYSYLAYKLIKVKQFKKIQKYASMTPQEIAKIKEKKKPKYEITVRGDR
jgi:hypothetical protein